MAILCLVFGHRRSTTRARRWEEGWRSDCVRCGLALRRLGHRKWVPMGEDVDGIG